MSAAFDQLASEYDRVWTRSAVGHLQREAVWRHIGALFEPGLSILDLGCGTGEDAVRLMQAGLRVRAIDASGEMVRIARARGVDAEILSIEDCSLLYESFDGILSNFGALNCVAVRRRRSIACPARTFSSGAPVGGQRTLLFLGGISQRISALQ